MLLLEREMQPETAMPTSTPIRAKCQWNKV